jgi:hypothetical protein
MPCDPPCRNTPLRVETTDFIRLLEPRFVGHTSGRRRYSSIKMIQIGEWRYCTDHNLSHSAQMIRDKYTHLANGIRQHRSGTEVDIPSIIITIAKVHLTHPPFPVSPPLFSPFAQTLLTNSAQKHDSPRPASQHISTCIMSNTYVSFSSTASNLVRPHAAPPLTAPTNALH